MKKISVQRTQMGIIQVYKIYKWKFILIKKESLMRLNYQKKN